MCVNVSCGRSQVRIARQNGYDKDVLPLALQAPRRTMLETAVHLEKSGAAKEP